MGSARETNCPYCNSLQRFAIKSISQPNGMVRRYIRCSACQTEVTIEIIDPEELELRQDVSKLKIGRIKGRPVLQTLNARRDKLEKTRHANR